MDTNENKEVVTTENDNKEETTADVDNDSDSTETTETEPKETETPEARLARLRRQVKQQEKKLGLDSEPKSKRTKSEDLGYGEKAFLTANGVKGSDEVGLVKEIMNETGRSLEAVLESKHFQGELKILRESRASSEAIPKGTKGTQTSAKDSVDYWIKKGELPPADQRELRTKVVNARIKAEKSASQFTSTPIAGNYRRQ